MRRLIVLSLSIALPLFLACGNSEQTGSDEDASNRSTGYQTTPATPRLLAPMEPAADLDPGNACDGQYGIAKVNALFYAINRGDTNSIVKMFATDQPINFNLSPDIIQAAETSVQTANNTQARSVNEIPKVVERLASLHIVFTEPLIGGTYVDHNPGTEGLLMVGVSPVMWKAVGPPLTNRGKAVAFGGGKTGIDCRSGLFVTVGLGVMTFQ